MVGSLPSFVPILQLTLSSIHKSQHETFVMLSRNLSRSFSASIFSFCSTSFIFLIINTTNNIITNNIDTLTEQKKTFYKNVYLYEYEYESLVQEYGIEKTKRCIEELSFYKNSKGVQYISDYDAIKRWVVLRVNELEKKKLKDLNNNSYKKYNQRTYPEGFFEQFYAN